MKPVIIIATTKTWNIRYVKIFRKIWKHKYRIVLIQNKDKLTKLNIKKYNPLYIFFPHWSWYISKDIYDTYTCVIFHMTDVPYGRGGSPLQNLLLRKQYSTMITAMLVSDEFDAGKILLKRRFIGLKKGSAEDILKNISDIIFSELIPCILNNSLEPVSQRGNVVKFMRRKPDDSNMLIQLYDDMEHCYNFIRMLDGEGYPKAYIQLNKKMRIEFFNVSKKSDVLMGTFLVKYEK